MNGVIRRAFPGVEMAVPPAANDAGTAVGAAIVAHRELTGDLVRPNLGHAYLGPSWDDAAIERTLQRAGVRFEVVFQGGTYLRPTIVRCDAFDHPLANREFLFPYASVVEVPQREMLAAIGPSLVVTAVTQDASFMAQLLDSPLIERLNLGAVPTNRVSWDQPHEGNMFEFLYKRRSLERA
jgi:hypothetical protein